MNWTTIDLGTVADVQPPRTVGKEVTFDAHGTRFRCRKLSQSCYCLTAPLVAGRARFGNRKEIAEDIRKAIETGALTCSKERGWA
jgi:hypothetical protein